MKVCYLSFDGIPSIEVAKNNRSGGLNVILFNLVKELSSIPKMKISFLYRYDGTVPAEKWMNCLLNVQPIYAGKPLFLEREESDSCLELFAKKVEEWWIKNNPEIVHTAGSESGRVALILRKKGYEFFWVHTNFATLTVRRVVVEKEPRYSSLNGEVGRRELSCIKKCDHVVALSEVDKGETASVFNVPLTKITVAEPGIDSSIFYPRHLDRLPIVISAGRMSRIKDFPFLIRSFAKTLELNKDPRLMLIIIGGNDTERNSIGITKMAKDLGIEKRVMFFDGMSQRKMAELFSVAKVFAGVSRHETFGMVPVEARACGTPFVVRSNSSYLETAKNGEGGYFTLNESEYDMALKINKILLLPEIEWKEVSEKAVESTKKYQWPRMAKKCLQIYENAPGR